MKRKLSALILAFMMIACMIPVAIFAADDSDAPKTGAAEESKDIVTPYGVIPEGFADPVNYPVAVFVDRNKDGTGWQFLWSYKEWRTSTSNKYDEISATSAVEVAQHYLANDKADVAIYLLADYDPSGDAADAIPNIDTFKGRTLIIDLNGHKLTLAQNLFYAQGKTKDEKIDKFILKNGIVEYSDRVLAFVPNDKKESGGFDITFENIKFIDKKAKPLVVKGGVESTEQTNVCHLILTFKGCSIEKDLPEGVAPLNDYLFDMTPYYGEAGDAKKVKIVFSCDHFSGGVKCDICGETRPVEFKTELIMGENFDISFFAKLPEAVSTAEITQNGTVSTVNVSELTPETDGWYKFTLTVGASELSKSISFKFLDKDGNVFTLANEAGYIGETYTVSIFEALKGEIEAGDAELSAAIDSLSKDLANRTAELEEALANKMNAEDVAASISKLRSDIEGAYKIADAVLGENITDIQYSLNVLKGTLEDAKTAINAAIAELRKDLEDKTAELEAAIATKAEGSALLEKYSELKSAYEAADVLFAENDEALKTADEAMRAAINELKKSVDEQEERISSAETMNIIQLVAVIVVFAVAVAALVLPMVKGKKKENE